MGLQYDDAAWAYFALAFLSLYLLPSLYYILTSLFAAYKPKSDQLTGAVERTEGEKRKAKGIRKRNAGADDVTSTFFKANAAITLFFMAVFVWMATSIQSDGEISSFDPYVILGIDRTAEVKEIKQAYRKKSLRYHPDKNPDDPGAEAMFMMIAKAYESLTDPAAKENWEKYGNPDGRQSMEVSIGLPTFLLDAEWKHTILLVYLFIMVVCIPAAVWLYYSNSSKYGERGVMYKSWGWFNHAINETLTYKSCPEVLSGCAEFHERLNPSTTNPNNGGEMAEMKRLQKAVGQFMNRPKYNHVLVVKGNLLMHAHLTRTAIENKAMQQDVEFMLSNCTTLLDAMIDHSHQRGWLEPAREIIVFTQHLTQAVWGKDCELMQLPYFGKAEIKHVTMGKVKTLKEYIKQDDDAKKGLAGLTAPQKADVLAVCALIPDMKVAVKTFVEDDEDSKIYQNDLITVRVDMDRLNLEEGEEAGLVHAPYFPLPKLEAWWVILATKDGKIVNIAKVTDKTKTFKHDIKFMAPPVGTYDMEVHVMSNSYVSLDVKLPVKFDVLSPDLLPEYKPHKDDMALDEEPTMFEQMMAGNIEEDSEDEVDSEDEEEDQKKLQANSHGKKGGESDSDSDSDEEGPPPLSNPHEEGKKDK